jgi:hypothetical protein
VRASAIKTLSDFEKEFLMLICAKKRRVFADGKKCIMWVEVTKMFTLCATGVAPLVGSHLDGVINSDLLTQNLNPTTPVCLF